MRLFSYSKTLCQLLDAGQRLLLTQALTRTLSYFAVLDTSINHRFCTLLPLASLQYLLILPQ